MNDIDGRLADKYDAAALRAAFEKNDPTVLPEGFFRVTGGRGGESYLITKYEKTVLMDTGMAYCGDKLVENVKEALNGRDLDIVILTHTHYDHIGALPQIRKAFPNAAVYGSAYAQYIFTREGALRVILKLGRDAEKLYGEEGQDKCTTEGLSIDITLSDEDRIDIGVSADGTRGFLRALECKGHTDCSLAYFIEPDGLLFANESTGVILAWDLCESSILKSFDESMRSVEKCRSVKPEYVINPHYGMLPSEYNEAYWDIYTMSAENEREFVRALADAGLGPDEILEKFTERFWTPEREKNQPKSAFLENAKSTVMVYASGR